MVCQQGRRSREAEAYVLRYVEVAERRENEAERPFQHPLSGGSGACRSESSPSHVHLPL